MNYDYFTVDMVQSAHGRAPAVTTGIKRANPENIVFSYQGDGDLAAIGTAETVHAAARGKHHHHFHKQRDLRDDGRPDGPTTLPGQVTQTSPYGRKVDLAGYPVRICGCSRLLTVRHISNGCPSTA